MTEELFKTVVQWQRQTFTDATPKSCAAHLSEETQELNAAINKNDLSNIKEELADCLLLLFGIADRCGMNYHAIEAAIIDKMMINLKRKWQPSGAYTKHEKPNNTKPNE